MGNFVLEALFNLCKEHGKKLIRYDYNEPCKGKDQCDREAAYAKSLMRSCVDAGNNIDSARDIAQALKHAGGLKNTKVAVAEVDSSAKRILAPPKSEIPGIKSYHSFVFYKTHMMAWRYYNIGKGVRLNYVGVKFYPTINLLEEFTTCQQQGWHPAQQVSRERESRMPNSLHFCPQFNCSQVFDTQDELERHCLRGDHTVVKIKSSSDYVKSSFVNHMTSCLTNTARWIGTPTASRGVLSDLNLPSMCDFQQGWALPKHKNFRFSKKQKSVLLAMFFEGERTGKKMSAEQAVEQIRQKKLLHVSEYVKASQIKSLFSRFGFFTIDK